MILKALKQRWGLSKKLLLFTFVMKTLPFMSNKILIALLSLLFGEALKCQKLLEFKPYDTTAYVYQLNEAQMDFIVERNGIIDTSFLFTTLCKKVSRNSDYVKALSKGNFLIATIDQGRINYSYFFQFSFSVSTKVIGEDVVVFVKDKKSRANLSTAKIRLNEQSIPFNEGYGGYVFRKNSVSTALIAQNRALLHVSIDKEYCVMLYHFNAYQAPYPGRRNWYNRQTLSSSGYFITDKPVYRPGDTLRLKAFLVNPLKGVPFKRRSVLTISEPQQNFIFTRQLKPVSPGAFVFEWKIPDTLKIDRTFQLNFNYKAGFNNFYKTSSFYLENYALNANQYSAFLLKDELYPGEDLRFRVRATDANGFPLQGTMIHYRLSLNDVQDFFGDSLTISAAKRLNYYERDTVYPYESAMDIRIPTHLLPDMDAGFGLEISFTDPNTFEQKIQQLYCRRYTKRENLIVFQQADSLIVRFLSNGRDTSRSYKLVSLSNGDTLLQKTVTTPYRFQLSPYATQVVLYDEKQHPTVVNVAFSHLDISKVKGLRSADSIRIAFSFPFDEAIYYRIFKKDKLVQQGKTKHLDFKIADNSKDPYSLVFTSNINNAIENNFYRITYVPPMHRITINTDLPATAFPGQKLTVHLEAKNCYNQPLKNINLAAFAVNKQFDTRFVTPEIAVPESCKDKIQISQESSTDQAYLNFFSFQNQCSLKSKDFKRFDLYHNEFYQLRYPTGEGSILSKKIQSPLPEFAISVTSNHIAYTPKYILLDGEPVYISDLQGGPYSFQAKTGTHQISFRFFDKKITLNNVSFESHHKYWLGFHLDSLKKSSSRISIIDSLPALQPDSMEKVQLYRSLLLTNPFSYDSLILKSNSKVVFESNPMAQRRPVSLYVDGDYFFAFGPLNPDLPTTLKLNKKTSPLKVSSDYVHYYDSNTQEFTSKYRGPVKGLFLGFSEATLGDYHLNSLQVPDSVKPAPENVQLQFNPEPNRAIQQEQEPYYSQNYNAGGPSQFSIAFKTTRPENTVKAVWIISKGRPEESSYFPVNSASGLQFVYKYGSDGNYDLYFLLSNKRMVVLTNHAFKNGDVFYVNPSQLSSEELNNSGLEKPLKLYSDLTKLPLLPFYFPPEESSETIKEIADAQRKNTYLHGYITNESLQPLSNVMVLAEVNGKFMYGAITNNIGEYEILDMLPGSYQLKLIHSSYQIKTFAPRFFKTGHRYELSSSLKDIHLQKPLLETIQSDFRFLVFKNQKRKDLMKLNVYDKSSREALTQCTLTVYEPGSESPVKILVGREDLELAFLPQNKVYRLEITRRGYVPVIFHHVRFLKNNFYALYVFMISEKENGLLKQKEYDLQMQNYPAEGDIELMYGRDSYFGGNGYGEVTATNAGSYSREEYQNLATKDIQLSAPVHSYKIASSDAGIQEVIVNQPEGSSLDEVTIASVSSEQNYAPEEMIDQVANDSDLNQTRKNFSDVGYWQPNLITDKKGQVSFDIRLPDNITTWKSTVLAMGKHHLHGMDTCETKAFKPLQVNTNVPPFVWVGDQFWTKTKFSNLTKDAKTIKANLWLNGKVMSSKEVTVQKDYLDSLRVDVQSTESLKYKATLQFAEKYKDEEERVILAYTPAFHFYTNQSLMMEKDSSYQLRFDEGTKGEIILNNTLYERIVEEINQLEKYEYSCVEQTSSQLLALLCKEKINRTIQAQENLTPSIYRLIRRLDNYQNKNGSWGWWKRQPANWRMTIYAVEALGKANRNGYNNRSFGQGVTALQENFLNLSQSDQLYAYSVLQQLGYGEVRLKKVIDKLKVEELPPIDKMYYYKIKQADGEQVNTNQLYTVYLELSKQIIRPYYGDFFYDPRSNLLTAYNLFIGSPIGQEVLQLFKRQLSTGKLDYQLNTYSKAALIEALTASTANTENKPVTAQVIINDSLTVKTFPYRLKINRSNYLLKHNDASVFVNTAEEKWIDEPKISDSLFKVNTCFVQKGKKTNSLSAGVSCLLNVDIDVYRSGDYVMVEVPIPSGMRFVNKPQIDGCSIEYFNNKVVIFYQRINMQQHHLSFEMLPAYKGSFVWPAAKCSLMYYPYLYGNNRSGTIEIR